MSLDQIVAYFEQPAQINPVTFQWAAAQLDNLLDRLEGVTKAKVDYDYRTKTIRFGVIGESELHYAIQADIRDFLKAAITNLVDTITDPEVCRRIKLVAERGTAYIKSSGFATQADVSFRERPFPLPTFVCEIS